MMQYPVLDIGSVIMNLSFCEDIGYFIIMDIKFCNWHDANGRGTSSRLIDKNAMALFSYIIWIFYSKRTAIWYQIKLISRPKNSKNYKQDGLIFAICNQRGSFKGTHKGRPSCT